MPFKRVTCPETAHLEVLELDYHPLGILVTRCSRFLPGCELACTRRCAALLDRRARSEREPREPGDAQAQAPRDEANVSSVSLIARSGVLSVGDDVRLDLDLDAMFGARRES
ncbi:MAG TPA: hypothetical protein VNO30_19560 [Kofleriaceae bacterium]|nr:hypothetical protein [Kofleriaceae bacterium]